MEIDSTGRQVTTLKVFEDQGSDFEPDPEETRVRDRRLVTQPYDLVIATMLDQINNKTLHLRPISDRPSFQRRYVWSDVLASRLIESILLSVPIPPCYLSQNEDYELDVIDGQQRIYSIYRFWNNQFSLTGLEILSEYNGLHFFKLPVKEQRKLTTYTLRSVVITNDSDPEIRFDVFERLNTNTVPLNAQELRNCIYRGSLVDLVTELAEHKPWLRILNRKEPDVRMQGEELILRFFAFRILGLESYRTPQKHWLNYAAKVGRQFPETTISELRNVWTDTIDKSLAIFDPNECFRRLPLGRSKGVINRALMDLTLTSLVQIPKDAIPQVKTRFRECYIGILEDPSFEDLITRAIDHKSRTFLRFEMWNDLVLKRLS